MTVSDRRPYALVVHDDPIIQLDACLMLEDAGFWSLGAENSDRGWLLLTQHHASIAVIFTEVHVPGSLNGFALARQVAAAWPDIAIIVASSHLPPTAGEMPNGAKFIGKAFSAELVKDYLRSLSRAGRTSDDTKV